MINNKPILERIQTILLANFVIISVLSIILFVLNHPIKYALFTFGVLLTWIFVLLSFKSNYRLKVTARFSSVKMIDYFLAGCSIIIFVYNVLAYPKIDIMLPFYMIISFFLPGWVLLRLLGIIGPRISTFSILPLSFCLSIGLTSIIFIASLLSKEVTTTLLSGTYAVVCLFPILKDTFRKIKLKQSPTTDYQTSYNLFEILVLLWIITFFAFVISSLYPNLAFVPSSDIISHLSLSEALTETPDIYSSEYVWFHSALAAVTTLSNTPVWLLQSAIACLSIFLIFSFYVMAKAYLNDIDRRAHLVATISFFAFSGFGWLYVLQQKFSPGISISYLDILSKSYNITYFDVANAQGWLWLWFRPLTMGFTIFFILLYLMKRNDLTRRNYIIIASLLLTTLSQVHSSEFVMFLILLFIVTLIRPTIKLRIRETAISALIALSASAILTISYQQFSPSFQTLSFQYLPILAFLTFLVLFLVRHQKRPSLGIKINSTFISSIVLFIFFIFLIHWLLNPDAFSRTNYFRILAVPWELYPLLLGIVGAIAIFGAIVVARKYRNHPVLIFLVFLVSAIVFGRILSYINATFTDTGYWERRVIPFVYFSCAILSSLVILKLMQWHEEYKPSRSLKNVLTVSVLSLLVLGGIFSTILSVDFQLETFPKRSLSENQSTLVNHLIATDPYSILLTVTDSSRNIAQFKNFGYVVDNYRYQLWPSKDPELPLNIFSSMNSSTIILLQQPDFKKIASQYENGYIASHILKVAPVTYRGPTEEVLEVPRVSPPSSNSDMVLVLPNNQNRIYYAYDILSLGGYNYTTALESDVNFISKAKIVVAPDDDTALKMIHYKKGYNFQFSKLLVLNLDGNGTLLDALAGVSNKGRINGDYISTGWRFVGNNSGIYSDLSNLNRKGGATTLNLGEPFIASTTNDGYEVFYLNARPIIEELDTGNADMQQIFTSLDKLLETADPKFTAYKMTRNTLSLVSGGVTTFRNATFTGYLALNSSSAIVNVDSPSLVIKIDGKSSDFKHVSEIIPIDTDKTVIRSDEGIISGGEGFYARALLNQSSIQIVGHPSVLLLRYNNGSSSTISADEVQINLEQSDVLMRQPTVESNGTVIFENFFAYGEMSKKLRSLGELLVINGKVSYDSRYSGDFTVVHNSSFDGKISHSTQVYSFDELGSLEDIFTMQNLPYITIIGLTLILGNVLAFHRRRLKATKLFSERSTTN